jgi:ABC-type nitrate/sulfonate/bicarbonate transport system substrate-binding protein
MVQVADEAPSKVDIVYAEGTGSFIVLLPIAQQQGFFRKFGVDPRCIAIRGATVPRLTRETPMGLIGEPAALLQAADGADVKIVASFSGINLSGHLIARPEIKTPAGLRGKRVGVRVIGAGLWISTILALEQLGLDPGRDAIATVPVGSPVQIVLALREGAIDAALVSVTQSREFEAEGFQVLLRDYPADISSFGGGMVVAASYLSAHPDVVENVLGALVQALAFTFDQGNRAEVLRAFETAFGTTDPGTVAAYMSELKRRPYASHATLEKMQRIMGLHEPRVLGLRIADVVEDRFVRKMDDSGMLARLLPE